MRKERGARRKGPPISNSKVLVSSIQCLAPSIQDQATRDYEPETRVSFCLLMRDKEHQNVLDLY
jgi:hypothetical protein